MYLCMMTQGLLFNSTYHYFSIHLFRLPFQEIDFTENNHILQCAIKQAILIYPLVIELAVIVPDQLSLVVKGFLSHQKIENFIELLRKEFVVILNHIGMVRQFMPLKVHDVFQKSLDYHPILNAGQWEREIKALHQLPVVLGFVSHPKFWPFSTYHRYMRNHQFDSQLSYSSQLE